MRIHLMGYRHLCSRMTYSLFFFTLMTIVVLPNSVFGKMYKGQNLNSQEIKALPRWCQCRMIIRNHVVGQYGGENASDSVKLEYKKWSKVIGEDIIGYTHHYCWGLNWLNRYKLSLFSHYEGVERDRDFALKSALSEFRFMRGRLRPKHALYYSMLMNEAYVYREKKNIKQAVTNYQEIMKLKPSYAFAYVEYAQLLNSFGRSAEARKILELGLKKTEGAKIIKQAMTTMANGGDDN